MSGSSVREKLDIESPACRQERLELKARVGHLFNSLSGSPSLIKSISTAQTSKTFAVPESDALARAKTFLPLLASSNSILLARAALDPNGVNIERTEGEEHVIAMDLGLGIFDAHGIGGDLGPAVEGSARKKQRVNDGQGKKVERGRGDDQENVDQRHGRHVNEVRNEDEIENQNKLGSSESNDDEESEADVTDDDRDTDEIDSDGSNDNSTDESEDSEASEDSDSSAEHDDNDDFDDDNIQHDNIFVTQKAQNRAHDIALHLPVTVSSQPLPISPVP